MTTAPSKPRRARIRPAAPRRRQGLREGSEELAALLWRDAVLALTVLLSTLTDSEPEPEDWPAMAAVAADDLMRGLRSRSEWVLHATRRSPALTAATLRRIGSRIQLGPTFELLAATGLWWRFSGDERRVVELDDVIAQWARRGEVDRDIARLLAQLRERLAAPSESRRQVLHALHGRLASGAWSTFGVGQ